MSDPKLWEGANNTVLASQFGNRNTHLARFAVRRMFDLVYYALRWRILFSVEASAPLEPAPQGYIMPSF